jgi:Protein of unknown function (DUF3015)
MNKSLKVIVATVLFSLAAVSTTASAADAPAAPKKDLNPWTDCGIGAMIFSEYPVAAVISNVIWDLGTTAVTSNMASQNTCSGKNAKAAMFIGTTYANLEEETVKGNGQHVSAMLNIMNCDASAHANIISAVRADFVKTLSSDSYSEKAKLAKAEAYYDVVQAKVSGEFASQCTAI